MMFTILRITYLRLRNNPLELVLIFVMPVIFFSIFAAIFSQGIASGTDQKIRVGWVCSHATSLGNELHAFLETNTLLDVSAISAQREADHEVDAAELAAILQAQQTGRYDLIVRLPSSFPNEWDPEAKTSRGAGSTDQATTPTEESAPTAAGSPEETANPTEVEHANACSISLMTDGQNPMAVAMVSSIVRGFFLQKQASLAVGALLNQRLAINGQNRPLGDMPVFSEAMPAVLEGRLEAETEPVRDPDQILAGPADLPWFETNQTEIIGSPSRLTAATEFRSNTSGEPASTSDDALPDSQNAQAAEQADLVDLIVETPQAAGQANPRIAMYAAGIAVLFLLFSATGHAATLLEEVESGTLDRILVSQAGLFHILVGKWLAILLMGCLQVTVMFLWAEAVFRIQLAQHWAGFCVMTVCTSAATASFAMFLASLCRSRPQLNAVSTVLILSMSAVGGSMIPRFAMSERMKEVGKWSFNAWALDGFQKVFWFDSPLSSLQMEVTILLGSAAVLGVMTGLLSSRWKRGAPA
jgi:ABC-2 type transport system permease protein